MREYIGNVVLNLDYYKGVDLYSDGVVEDEILDIVSHNSPQEYNRIIREKKQWPILYHLSHIRSNIVSFLPITKNQKVLEIGSGCGAITGQLSDMAHSVTCVELSKKRSVINATRNRQKDNIEIIVGNFQDIEPQLQDDYDIITLIGVFEYASSYIECAGDSYMKFMEIVAHHLKKGGVLVLAIENKYGLKYFAGWKEDHLNMYFESIEGYINTAKVKTFSRESILGYAKGAGLVENMCYYPCPDYKFPLVIYSDMYLPSSGEMSRIPHYNFDLDRTELFDINKAFDSVIQDGLYQHYANSFLMIFSKE